MQQAILQLALVMAALPLLPRAGHAQVRDSASVAAVVRRSESDFSAAVVARDTTRLRSITWPQFAFISPKRVLAPLTRTAWFSAVQASRTQSLSPHDMIVQVFSRRAPWHRWADLAIATYVADVRTATDGASRAEAVFITDTWRLDRDRWRMIERSVSGAGAVAAK